MSSASPLLKKDTAAVAYYPPSAGGGSEFSMVNATLGEPLNVSIDSAVTFMVDEQRTGDSLRPEHTFCPHK